MGRSDMSEPSKARPAGGSAEPGRVENFRWQALFRRAAEPLFLLNRRQRILFANAAWLELTGIPLAEARTLFCKKQRAAEPGSREAILQALSPPLEALQGRATQARRLVPQPGGSALAWEVAFFPLRGPDGLLGILGRIAPGPVEQAAAPVPLPGRLLSLRERLEQWHRLEDLGEQSPALRRAGKQMCLAAVTTAPVLLVGEVGTGKQWAARAMHQRGPLANRAFVTLDCEHLPAAVLEAVLFDSGGLVHRAGIGTLYLREPQCLPRELQARLAELAGMMPGSGDGQRPGPRLMAGCTPDPTAAVHQGRLLEELHCALGVLTIALPPLRARPADFGGIVRRLLARAAADSTGPPALTAEAWEVLRAWSWPGNLGELYSVLRGACARAGGPCLQAEDLPWYVRAAPPPPARSLPLKSLLQEVERRLIRLALKASGHNRTRAAKLLSIWRPLLVRRIRTLGIEEEGQ
jgi:transcriptional regulator of acetoin/glycerol metabolism